MISLNLLPPTKKQELRLMQLYIAIKNLIILVLILTICAAITLLITKMTLQKYFEKTVNDTTLTTKYANIFGKDIKEFNNQVKAVDDIQKNHISWTNFFINFSKLVPDGVTIKTMTINQGKVLLTGFAKTRNSFLIFKDNLEKSELFSEVITPLENILQKEEIDFNIKASLNQENIK